jgi:hypothetical protein
MAREMPNTLTEIQKRMLSGKPINTNLREALGPEIIQEILDLMQIPVNRLVEMTGLTRKTINTILRGDKTDPRSVLRVFEVIEKDLDIRVNIFYNWPGTQEWRDAKVKPMRLSGEITSLFNNPKYKIHSMIRED